MSLVQNGKIVFYRDIGGFKYQIFSMNSDGSNLTNLSLTPTVSDTAPAYSPDGNRIVFARNNDIYTMNADGSNKQVFPGISAPYEAAPDWSPDGSKILFTSFPTITSNDGNIFSINTTGTNLKQLTYAPEFESGGNWLADGTKIAFHSREFNGIVTMNADGSNGRALTSNTQDINPSWSPDGTKIAFARNSDIYSMNADGTGIVNLTNTFSAYETSPQWSPDGKKISFTRDQNPNREIWLMNPDGSGQVKILDNGHNNFPKWQPIPNNRNVAVSPHRNINLTFSQIDAPGKVSAIPLPANQMPPLPGNFVPGSPLYDIRTSASYAGFIRVSLTAENIPNSTICANMRVLQFTNGSWTENNNDSPFFNSGTCTVSQMVLTLSPFMIANINFSPLTSSLSGNIGYGITPNGQTQKIVSNVTITAAGSSYNVVNSNSSGAYLLDKLVSGGTYNVLLSKSGHANGISSFDGTLVLRHVAAGGAGILTPNQQLAADTNNDGLVTSFDATLILRYVAANGQNASTGSVGNWKFTPAQRSYDQIFDSMENENYAAILIGEINGDWTPPSTNLLAFTNEESASARNEKDERVEEITSKKGAPTTQISHLSVGTKANQNESGILIIPIFLTNNNQSISGFAFDVEFDSAALELDSAQPFETNGTLSRSGFSIVSDTTAPGRIGIAAASGTSFINETGTLMKLRFKVRDAGKIAQSNKMINLSRAQLENKS
jgi:TolB protein